ncbi:uncharacterized protein [Eucyclogobius newberryi]|uniref:uncharacterized protein n=1 Tax=Eucyclogobius newberryi TaxID=166745 RepID=UPI003B5C9111
MENPTENPIAVKVEEHTQSLILTYFHGDSSSMVDAHFSRALNRVSKAKAPASKSNKVYKKIRKEDPCSPWHTFPSRTGEGLALPSMTCPNGLSVTGQQCSASLLNLLHSDRTEMSSSSKVELLQNWMVPQVDPSNVFEPGRHLDKKDLYWY